MHHAPQLRCALKIAPICAWLEQAIMFSGHGISTLLLLAVTFVKLCALAT